MGRRMPDAAQSATGPLPGRQHGLGFGQMYWQHRKARDISADKHASYIFVSLLIGVLFHNVALLWRQEGVFINATVAVMLLHIIGECCFSYCISKHVNVYIEHRTMFIMIARMAFQACMLYYVPRTWTYTVPVHLAANKHMAQTYRLLFAYTSSSLLETLAYQLPMQAAVPYHITRALLYGYVALPQLIRAMTTHVALAVTAKQIWVDLTHFYGSVVGLILGADVPGLRKSTVTDGKTVVVVVVIFVHIAYGLVVPLYTLGVLQTCSQRAFAKRLRAEAGNSDSSSPATSATAMPGGSLDARNGTGASSRSSGVLSADATAMAPAGSAVVSGQLPDTADTRVGSRVWHDMEVGIGLHAVTLFCVTMLLWALTESAVSMWIGRRGC